MDQFKDQIRTLTQRKIPLRLGEVIETINPIIREWGNYYCRSHVRKRFHQLDGWIIRRPWSRRTKRWRNAAWRKYPTKRLRTEFKAGQPRLAHTSAADRESSFMKAGYGKTVRPVCAADGGKLFIGRLLRPDSWEVGEQGRAIGCGTNGAKGRGQGKCGPANHTPGTEPGKRVTSAGTLTTSNKAYEEGTVHLAAPPRQRRSPSA